MCVITGLIGMAVGAAVGGVMAGVNHGNVLKGALVGGLFGAVSGGMGGAAVSAAASSGTGLLSGLSATAVTALSGTAAGLAGAAGGAAGGRMISDSALAKRQQAEQRKAIEKLSKNEGELEVNKVATGIQQPNSRLRTISSLRISMLPQKQETETITKNVYGVDDNSVATATKNMMGLNIAAA